MPNEAVPKFVTPVDSLRDFKTIALDMIKRGVHVSPARPGRRYSDLPDWQNKATLDPAQVDIWAAENPNYNCVSVAKAESVCILDIDDVKKAVAMGFPSYPGTLVVRTPRGGRHIYFKNPGLITG